MDGRVAQGSHRPWDTAFEVSRAALVTKTLPGLRLYLWTHENFRGEIKFTIKLNEVYTSWGLGPNFRRSKLPRAWKSSGGLLKTQETVL